VLGSTLLTRVTGDVVSFLAALDRAVLEGSPEILSLLEDAIDALMRSAARLRIELGRRRNRDGTVPLGSTHGSTKKRASAG